MSTGAWIGIAVAALVVLALIPALVRALTAPPRVASFSADPDDRTSFDPETYSVRSIQGADFLLPVEALDKIWSPMHLERLARTYWRFLSRVTLGLIHVSYTLQERCIVLLGSPFVLLRFQAPEYELDGQRGLVRWRIERGLLVSRRGRGGNGYLQIEVERRPAPEPGMATLRVEVEVNNFYPSIAARFGRFVYANTQSRIHVLVTHAFLRSLSRLDLARSRVGLFELPQ